MQEVRKPQGSEPQPHPPEPHPPEPHPPEPHPPEPHQKPHPAQPPEQSLDFARELRAEVGTLAERKAQHLTELRVRLDEVAQLGWQVGADVAPFVRRVAARIEALGSQRCREILGAGCEGNYYRCMRAVQHERDDFVGVKAVRAELQHMRAFLSRRNGGGSAALDFIWSARGQDGV